MAFANNNSALTKGSLGFLNRDSGNDLKFQFNPKEMRRNRRATYANNNAALADFPNAGPNAAPAFEWIRNEAEDFSITLFFHVDGDGDIDTILGRLDEFMQPDDNGQPRDLVLTFGPRYDIVRIMEKDVVEKLHSSDLRVQEAEVSIKFRALRSAVR